MLHFFDWHIDRDSWLLALGGLVSLSTCLTSFGLMVRARAGGAYRPSGARWAAVVFATGLWATLLAFMLALHPAVPLFHQLGVTLLAVAAALAIGWLGLAASLRLHPALRPPGAAHARLGDVIAQALAAAESGSGRGFAAASLLALAICGLDFVAVGGTPSQTVVASWMSAPIMLMPNIPPGPPIGVAAMLTRPASPGMLVLRQASAAAGQAIAGAASSSASDITALATEIAMAHRIDPRLVLAIIATESSFQVNAVSPGNAQGLMQLTPATARRFGARNILNPAENIRAGTKYLRWLLAYFEGDISLALAGYNAGEGAVLRYGGVPPFPETRLYLKKIRSLYPAERHPFEQVALR
jgi:NO-binding membrane sensor protein with MHYT domain